MYKYIYVYTCIDIFIDINTGIDIYTHIYISHYITSQSCHWIMFDTALIAYSQALADPLKPV